MERLVGTVVRGVRAPIIREGDDIAAIIKDSVIAAAKAEGFEFHDRDVVAATEAIVARAQGNYASIDDIAADVIAKMGGKKTVGIVAPILSRNRFSICLKGIAKGAEKVVVMLSYPSDEVGNSLVDLDLCDEKGVNPYSDTLDEAKYRELFGYEKHIFTGVDYVDIYREMIEESGATAQFVFSNRAGEIVKYAKHVICCDIHTRARTKRIVEKAGAEVVLTLADILNESVNGCGFNPDYGLLGSNKSTETTVKLFPRDCKELAIRVQAMLKEETGKNIEVMVYGDGAFKDPVGKIWELADPVVSPGYTDGLEGQPNEIKLKYIADNDFAHLKGDELKAAVTEYIKNKDAKNEDLTGNMVSQGTTPRRLTDLIGSLCDLTSGSGDKGTPIVLVQGYFDNYTK